MKVCILQPPYPASGTSEAAQACIEWMTENLATLSAPETDLVLLPEYANCPGLEGGHLLSFAQTKGEQFVAVLRKEAQRLSARIVVGLLQNVDGILRNRCLVISPAGSDEASYDKVHLPKAEEELGITAGSEAKVVELDGLKVGFATCFDVYFPEYFEALRKQNPNLILSVNYQRSESAERLRLISAARALDCSAFFIRSAYAMPDANFGGRSLLAAPDGSISAALQGEPGMLKYEFDPTWLFTKPASHGQKDIAHNALISSRRRPAAYSPCRQPSGHYPLICAHRGLSELVPENTLPAFGAALAMPGVHEIELDLWESADGVPVVCHDPRVDRTTDGEGIVTELDWAQIRSFDAGCRHGEAWRGLYLPRFEEVLDMVNGRAGINIHIKAPGKNGQLVRRVADLLRERGMDRLGYIAGESDVLAAAQEYAPDIPRACLAFQSEPKRMIKVAMEYQCERLQFFRDATEEEIREARDLGLICNLFWSDDRKDAQTYVNQGIDVVLTNAAHRLVGLRRQ